MSNRLLSVMKATAFVVLCFLLVAPAGAKQNAANAPELTESHNGLYIVQMLDDPVVAYEGGIKGLKATKPRRGNKVNPKSPAVVDYVDYLRGEHGKALGAVGGGRKVYGYYYSFNGFAAEMTLEQAKKMLSVDGVATVSPDEIRTLDTDTSPSFLRLDAPGGLWDQLGGIGSGGEDVIIGIIDGGYWPENPSFTDRTGSNGNGRKSGKLGFQHIPGWNGKCTPGEAFAASHCNQKVIGARYYNAGWGGDAGIDEMMPWEYNSPRDFGGHGSHTASTAAGNNNVPLTGQAALFGSISGIAPRARIAAYKVCYETGAGGSCTGVDLVAAIDQAVADGVDVINYSISGTRTNFADAVEIAFLFAADAGIFVAASAGNSGPTASTVAHPSPWITTVAASTHRSDPTTADVELGDGSVYSGASSNKTGAGPADLVYSKNVGMAGADPIEAQLCYPGTLDPAMVTGKIVLCDRGQIARVDKSLAVYMAGGIGMIHANVGPGSINADYHSVPTVHVVAADGDLIRDYVENAASPTAEIFPGTGVAEAPVIAGFSSRGPLQAGGGDLLKPDVSAPGVNVMAAVAPPWNFGEDYALYSGTSMASPHVAGLAALLMDRHPDWSPMMIKSALMTTGYDLNSDGDPDPFAQGAGHVDPNSAADPGLVFNHDFFDWLAFLCGTTSAVGSGTCAVLESWGYSTDPTDMNVASIAVGAMVGSATVSRTVTNVSNAPESYEFSASVDGIQVTANPSSFMVSPGGSETIEITLTADGAEVNTYATGHVTWTGDQGHEVRVPVAVQPVQLDAPSEVSGSGTDSSLSFDVSFGYTGAYTAAPHGLEEAMTQASMVDNDPASDFATAWDTCDFDAAFPWPCTGITWHQVSVPAGTALTRISLFDDYTDGEDDLDLNVWDSTLDPDSIGTGLVGGSGSGTSAEEVNLLFPADAMYYVAVHGWQTDGDDANYTLFSWSVSATPGGNLSIDYAPGAANLGVTDSVDLSWAGLDEAKKYLGAVSHSDSEGLIGLTVVSVETD